MAAKNTKTKTQNKKPKTSHSHKPTRQSSWENDLGIGYATYDHESDYQSPANLDGDKLDALQSFHQRLATAPIFVENSV